jgi:hypothetical protein
MITMTIMKIQGIPTVKLDIAIRLTEEEAGALGAMAGYGDDAFIRVFYEHLGRAYMEKYEAGLRSFLKTARGLDAWILRADKARKAFEE